MFARTSLRKAVSPLTQFVIESKGTLKGPEALKRCSILVSKFRALSPAERSALNSRARLTPSFTFINDRIRFNRLVKSRYPTMVGKPHERLRKIAKIWKWKKLIGAV